MTTLPKVRLSTACRVAAFKLLDKTVGRRIPRRCTVIAFSLMSAGLAIPLLMAARLLPITLLFGLSTLVLLATGGGLLLTRCGEV